MTRPLTKDEQATNAETQAHILEVSRRLNVIATMLIHRGTAHDCSKLEDPEVKEFTRLTPILKGLTYGTPEYAESLKELGVALTHHYAENRHHPEHFPNGIAGMNLIDLVEMFCDWKAASLRHADGDINDSITKNTKRFKLDPQVVALFENTVRDLGWGVDKYEYRTTQGQRKAWDGEPDLTSEGWEKDPDKGRPGESWDRFDFHEERYWRRLKKKT